MAATVTKLAENNNTTANHGSHTSASFTPADNVVLLAFLFCDGDNGNAVSTATAAGGSLTWTRRAQDNINSGGFDAGVVVFSAVVTTSPGSMTCAVTLANNTDFSTLVIVQCTDSNDVAGAVANSAISDPTGALTLAATPASADTIVAARALYFLSGTAAATPGSGWTELSDTDTNAGTDFGVEVQYRSATTSTSVVWTDIDSSSVSSVFARLGAAIIVKAATTSYTLTAATGSYTISGKAAGLSIARKLAAAAGSYAISGKAATLRRGYRLTAATGSYSIGGVAAALRVDRKLVAAAGSYTITGRAAVLTKTYLNLVAGTGSYAITGVAAALRRGLSLAAAAGSYAITGQAATLRVGRKLVAATGTYNISGQAAAFLRSYALAGAAGAYTITGMAATLTWSGEGGFTLAAGTGSYAITGNAAALRVARKLVAAAGSYAITGNAAALAKGFKLAAAAGSYAITGVVAVMRAGRVLTAASGSYVISGFDATLTYAQPGAFNIGVSVPYWAIKQALASAIETNVPGTSAQIEVEFAPLENWVAIYTDTRTAPAEIQRAQDGRTTRFYVTHTIVCWRYATTWPLAASLRDALLGDVEAALMLDRTLGNLCETSWFEGGRFLSVPDNANPGAFWGGAEITFVADVTAMANAA
ncbi:MAG: hypothetical protein HC889_00700 [Synechococcaceae cyanobacterium SM1_2_3]|nr:hypothetical protein [Synechococcaceae cyanobacterium SM1_2_3]